ncbi:MAG: L-rhamnose isomerase [Acetatifactor muris]|nr:L-rhamnose isomerase [Acetatifactor muris]
MLPFGDVWNYYCEKSGVPGDFGIFGEVKKYEDEVLSKRI